MRLNTGRTPSLQPVRAHLRLGDAAGHRLERVVDHARAARAGSLARAATCAERSASCASRASEKPIAFSRRIPAASLRQPVARAPAPRPRRSPASRSRNHGSKPAIALIRSTREALAQRLGGDQQPVRRRPRQRRSRSPPASAFSSSRTRSSPLSPVSSPRSAFCRLSANDAPDRHHLADRLHRRRQQRLGALELLEGEARDLGDDIIDRRLEARRRRAAGDVVGDLVERVADRQLAPRPWRSGSRSPSTPAPTSATRAGSSRSPPSARSWDRLRTGRWNRLFRHRFRAAPRCSPSACSDIPCRSASAPGRR